VIRLATAAVVCTVAAFAAVVSYSHIYGLGRAHGQDGTAARLLLWLGIGANIAFGAGYGLLGALISAWPAVAFIGSVEIAMQQVRRARAPRAATSGPAVPGDVEQAVRAAYVASVAAG
jgi:hypothetical protein